VDYLSVATFFLPIVTDEAPILRTCRIGRMGMSPGVSMSNAVYACRKEFCDSHECSKVILRVTDCNYSGKCFYRVFMRFYTRKSVPMLMRWLVDVKALARNTSRNALVTD